MRNNKNIDWTCFWCRHLDLDLSYVAIPLAESNRLSAIPDFPPKRDVDILEYTTAAVVEQYAEPMDAADDDTLAALADASMPAASVPAEMTNAQEGTPMPDDNVDTNLGSFVVSNQHTEESIMDAALVSAVAGYDEGLTCTVVNSGIEKQKFRLVDSLGCTYIVKHQTPNYTGWTCSLHCRSVWCKAGVKQHGDTFGRRNTDPHPPTNR